MQPTGILHTIGSWLNVSRGEWSRLTIAWITRFCFQLGNFLGWMIILALFTSRYGAHYLPLFFLIHALAVLLGSVFGAFLIGRFPPIRLIRWGIFLIILTLTLAYLLGLQHDITFFTLLLFAQATLGSQISILLADFAERLFAPLEAERIFPLVESAETLGGIAAGAIAVIGVSLVPLEELLWTWGISLLTIILAISLYKWLLERDLPRLIFRQETETESLRLKKILSAWKGLRRFQFLRGLALAIIIQWFIFWLLDFQYTLVIEHEASLHTTPHHDFSHSLENQMAHALGFWHIIFSLGGLLMQLFITSRILIRYGIVSAMLLQPTLMSLIFATLLFFLLGGGTFPLIMLLTMVSKALLEMTGVVHKNAIHSAYYSFPEKERERVKEFLEGMMRPLGALLGGLTLLIISQIWHNWHAITFTEEIILLLASLLFLLTIHRLRRPFTDMVRKILEKGGDDPDRFDAIEVLAQPGHHEPTLHLVRRLNLKKEPTPLKLKIIETLASIKDPQTIPDLLQATEDPDTKVQKAAVEALGQFQNIGKNFYTEAFTRHRIIKVLTHLLSQKQTSKGLRRRIIRVFEKLHAAEIIPTLISLLSSPDPALRSDAVAVMGYFQDGSIAHYLSPLLKDQNPPVRANTIIALWQFKRFRLRLLIHLVKMMESKEEAERLAGIYVLGEIHAIQEKQKLTTILQKEKNTRIELYTLISLIKMQETSLIPRLVEIILSDSPHSEEAQKMAKHLNKETKQIYQKILRRNVSEKILTLLQPHQGRLAHHLPTKLLHHIEKQYLLLGEVAEAMRIRRALKSRPQA